MRVIIAAVSFVLFLTLSVDLTARAGDLEDQLLATVKLGEPNLRPFDFEKFKSLIEKGADVNARDKSGQSVLMNTVLSHVYLADDHPDKKPLLEAVRLLARKKADVNVPNFLDITPLMWAVHRSHSGAVDHPVPKIRPIYDVLLLETDPKPDLNFRSVFGGTVLSYLASWDELEEVKRVISLGGDVHNVDTNGNTVFSSAARQGRGKADALKSLLALLTPEQRQNAVSRPNFAGSTPLIQAVRGANAEVVDLLLNAYSVDPNAVNVGGENALSIALEKKSFPRQPPALLAKYDRIVEMLNAHGAQLPIRSPESTVLCSEENQEPFGFGQIQKLVTQCGVTSLDRLIPLLPKTQRSNYMFSYRPRGIQKGDELHPRVISMGRDAKTILAFGGDPRLPGYDSLEMIEFKDDSDGRRFEMREVDFSGGKVQFSEKNPAKCLGCHGQEPRPRWDNQYLRPGFYYSEQGALWPKERESFNRFVSTSMSKGRYQALLPQSDSPFVLRLGQWDSTNNASNLYKPDAALLELNSDVISWKLSHEPKLNRLRYAILAALSCPDPISEFIPQEMRARAPRSYEDLLKENIALDYEEFAQRVKRQLSILGIPYPQGTLAQDFVDGIYQSGQGYETQRMARLRYLLEGTGVPMNWSMTFSPEKEYFVVREISFVELKLWKDILGDSATDQALKALYQKRENELPYSSFNVIGMFRGSDFAPVFDGVDTQPLCGLLKEASLKLN